MGLFVLLQNETPLKTLLLPVGRDRKILTVLRTNQIAAFVTVPSWEKNHFKDTVVSYFLLWCGHHQSTNNNYFNNYLMTYTISASGDKFLFVYQHAIF